ncbi:MAG: amino acid racemase [Candidatus Krumholzibacteria bacterium]|nr:amino acid racemase [Candidatus Krumholzibacteria bacterium]
MKKIGIVGGLGPEPTIEYYRIITSHFHGRSEGYPRIIIYSLDVDELCRLFEAERWDEVTGILLEGVNALLKGGADFGLIAANTPHIVFDDVQEASLLPLLNIVTETLRVIKNKNLRRVGLLGTKFTMQATLFQKELNPAGIEVFVPDESEQEYIQDKIYSELTVGRFTDETRSGLHDIVENLIERHSIEGIILGCTELPLILKKDEYGIPFLNTTRIHAESAIRHCS